MGDQQELQKLTKQLDASLNRIDRLQKGQTAVPAGRRLYRMATSPSVWGAVMSGILFTVVLNRLSDKSEYQVRQWPLSAELRVLLVFLLMTARLLVCRSQEKRAALDEERERLHADVHRCAGAWQACLMCAPRGENLSI